MKINRQSIAEFLLQELEKQRRSLFLWLPVAMGAGIMAYFFYGDHIVWNALVPAIVFGLLAVAKSYHSYAKTGQNRWLIAFLISSALAMFVIGYGVIKLRTDTLNTPMITKDLSPKMIEGDIEKLANLEGGKAKRVILKNAVIVPSSTDSANGPKEGEQGDITHYRFRLKTYHFKGDDWQIGDHVQVKAKLIPPSGPVMPNGFDFGRKAFYEGISAVGFTMGDATLLSRNGAKSGYIEQIRRNIASFVYQALPSKTAGVAQALLTGERSGLNDDDANDLRASGLAHLLAISGLHIGLVAGCVFFFVRLFLAVIPGVALRYPIKKWAAVAAICIAFCYMILAGATVPTVRAFIMTSLVLLAVIMDRSAMNMRLVALAALFVMITTPEAVVGPSFVLSFAAVAALIVFYRDFGRKWLVNANAYRPLYRPFYYVAGIAMTSIVATLATAPFSVMFFNRFAVYGVISNILAMPLMAFVVMPFGLMATMLIPFGLDGHFWGIMGWGIDHIIAIANAVAAYPYANITVSSFDTFETILILCGFLLLVFWRGVLRFIGIPLILFAFISAAMATPKQIMISEDMKAILIVDKSVDKFYLIGKMNSYLNSNWLGFHGIEDDVDIPQYRRHDLVPQGMGACDDFMCRIRLGNVDATVLFNATMMAKACKNSDIVIATMPIDEKHHCRPSANKPTITVIDWFDVWRHGATIIDVTHDGYDIQMVK